MSTDQFSLFFATLGLVALVGALAIVIGLIVSPALRRAGSGHRPVDELARSGLPLAFAVAVTATLGSLYYSEIAHFVPCRFCWYQRIAMYPLAFLLGIATVLRDRAIWRYALPLALVGAATSAYHYQLQLFPEQGSGSCSPEAPCTARYVWEWGFVSIPFLALSGFLAVAALMLLTRAAYRSGTGPDDAAGLDDAADPDPGRAAAPGTGRDPRSAPDDGVRPPAPEPEVIP